MTRHFVRARRLLAVLVVLLSACHAPAPDKSDPTAISSRPQSYERFIAILKLKTPALLETATTVDGVPVIDQAQKEALLAEQEATIAELQALSPDIQVLYRYRLVLNGLAIIAPKALEERFRQLDAVSYVERQSRFERAAPVATRDVIADALENISTANSVSFIGAARVHAEIKVPGQDGNEVPVTGQGIRVGVIDTGIDYTHAMFGGAGTEEAFAQNNPNEVEAGTFPTAKVVGGIDFVGTDFDSSSPRFEQHIPQPDQDPIDEGGHGTHVAGTIAGLGDDTETYSGVAPEAALYAIKVFGKNGSTGDAVIIASLEYSADPNADLNPADRLDVINLSLGSGFGTPHILYTEAVANLVKGNTIVVASAGNSGANSYIVGAPSTSDAAISVAASIDDMPHNWKFRAVKFRTPSNPEILTEALEATFTKAIEEAGEVSGKLVWLGLAAKDLTDEQKAAVRGNVAFIERGEVAFADKVRRAAEAGAIGVVVHNNVEGDPFIMGGDGSYDIPGIMISLALAQTLKTEMANGDVVIDFLTPHKVEKPELVDTLTGFSSRGPRSVDGAIKPEIAAPGANVISAKMGGGRAGVKMSGTSMAAPHMAGVMALLRQAKPTLSADALKSLAVTTSVAINDATGTPYPVAHAGAGRVEAYLAARAQVAVTPATLSLGEVLVENGKTMRRELTLHNTGTDPVALTLEGQTKPGLSISLSPNTVELAAGNHATVVVDLRLQADASTEASRELDGFVVIHGDQSTLRVPVLAVANRATRVAADSLKVHATSAADAAGALGELTLSNRGKAAGVALPFNLLAKDERKDSARVNPSRGSTCDLESVGWRIVKSQADGAEQELLQIAVKLYNPVTSWHLCEVSVLIDRDLDGVADQELLGTHLQTLTNNAAHVNLFASALTDAHSMREIRRTYETTFPESSEPTYEPAILDAQDYTPYGHSTIAVLSADLKLLAKTATGDLRIKVATLADPASPSSDDFLGKLDRWYTLTPMAAGQSFTDLPEQIELAAGETRTVNLVKGGATGDLVLYLPYNESTTSLVRKDAQAKVIKPRYTFN